MRTIKIIAASDLALAASLSDAVLQWCEETGLSEGQILSEEHMCAIGRALEWVRDKYGPPA